MQLFKRHFVLSKTAKNHHYQTPRKSEYNLFSSSAAVGVLSPQLPQAGTRGLLRSVSSPPGQTISTPKSMAEWKTTHTEAVESNPTKFASKSNQFGTKQRMSTQMFQPAGLSME